MAPDQALGVQAEVRQHPRHAPAVADRSRQVEEIALGQAGAGQELDQLGL
jgi:hypothetical protein